ncbi:uncharacterized protein LOC125777356 [Bactrocera dorsalis]|uniref:Uncharacterized protein LOC125777356 n=1 Tax=Bactrocera dorsalis TaxID=27457 RepID=A0ABM3JFQ8_BACDO|nr:uncharacterized protein LOC125777356 [Bactrocera dorsalis]XP_049308071.1 uncharacterized protein LOC125777356 [Bactrocera dorsalis]
MSCSKRHLKRLFKAKKEFYTEQLAVKNEASVRVRGNDAATENIAHCNSFHSTNATREKLPLKNFFRDKIKAWQIKNRIGHKSLRELLFILKEENLDVPLSPLVLLDLKNEEVVIEHVPGKYVHLGLKNQIKKIESSVLEFNEIVFDINFDGLPLFNSSRTQLWPILIRIVNIPNISVFPVGIYKGKQKPSDIDKFLSYFVNEFQFLKVNGLEPGGKICELKIRSLICDAPARAFACGIPHHTSAHGCSKCTAEANKFRNTLVYPTKVGKIVSDEDFDLRRHIDHHQIGFRTVKTPFEKVNLKMITQVPLDPMHLIDLGVMKKFLVRILKNKLSYEKRLCVANKKQISDHLESLKIHIPKKFVRLPRSIEQVAHWKATEFRQFLLYTGILVLKDKVHEDVYYEFLLLHCACRLLSCSKNVHSNLKNAEDTLKLFVENFPKIFGDDSVSYNVHSLLHLADSVKTLGAIQNFSAYDFENYLQN